LNHELKVTIAILGIIVMALQYLLPLGKMFKRVDKILAPLPQLFKKLGWTHNWTFFATGLVVNCRTEARATTPDGKVHEIDELWRLNMGFFDFLVQERYRKALLRIGKSQSADDRQAYFEVMKQKAEEYLNAPIKKLDLKVIDDIYRPRIEGQYVKSEYVRSRIIDFNKD
jgi:hypothetical protein